MSEVLHEWLEGGILLLRINRPEAKNALNQEVRRLLAEHCSAAGARDDVKVIVLTGNETAFAADIKATAEASPIELMLRRNHEHGRPSRAAQSRSSLRSTGMRWAVVASSLCTPTSLSPARTQPSASRKCGWASCQALAARSA